jgi:hypothetical protein
MYWVSFSKDAKGVVVHVARNGGPRKSVGTIRKQGGFYVLALREQGEYVPCSTLADAKNRAKCFYQHGEVQGVLAA